MQEAALSCYRAMKESSWREQEELDRRMADLEAELTQVSKQLEHALAEGVMARKEAAMQRRLSKTLQQRPAGDNNEATKHMV